MRLLLAFLLLASYAFAADAPLASLTAQTTGSTTGPLQVQTVVKIINSDTRFDDVLLHVGETITPVHAPRYELQTITTTLALSTDPPACGQQIVYDLPVYAEVVTTSAELNGQTFGAVQIGGIATVECAPRLYVPLVRR